MPVKLSVHDTGGIVLTDYGGPQSLPKALKR